MVNKFEVTLVGNDQLGGMIDQVNEKVNNLSTSTGKAAKGLGDDLTGKKSKSGLEDLDKKFSSLAVSARNNVQNIGDMVPPLKNFGELSSKILGGFGKFGIAGGLVYGASTIAKEVGNMAQYAHDMDVSARNLGLSAEKYSMILGAYKLSGVGKDQAGQSLSSLSDTFNDVIRGRGNGNAVMSQLAAFGVDRSMIPTKSDMYGNQVVDLEKLLPILEKIYRSIDDRQIRHEFAKTVGLDAGAEALFNDNLSVLENYNEAYKTGLVIIGDTNKKLADLNIKITDTGAAFEGWLNKTKENLFVPLAKDGGFIDTLGEKFKTSGGITSDGIKQAYFMNPVVMLGQAAGGISRLYSKENNNPGSESSQSLQNIIDGSAQKKSTENEKAFLDLVAYSEGTYGRGDDGYNVTFGGGTFNNGLAYHPNIQRQFMQTNGRMNSSGAAGRYQFLNSTWNDLSSQLGLPDFGKESQDKAALELIRQAGALGDVQSGDWSGAVGKLGHIWASFPSSPYPQGTNSYEKLGQEWNKINSAKPLAQDIAQAINQNPTQITLRIENDRGQSKTISTQSGATIAASMDDF